MEERQNWSDPPQVDYWPRETGSYIGRHWNGELSLGASFWVNCVVISLLFNLVVFIVGFAFAHGSLGLLLAVLWPFFAMSLVIAVWQLVGTWRSAENHKRHTGRKGWAVVAQVLIVLAWIGVALNAFDTVKVLTSLR
jgi:hypothetical protein